MAGRGVFVVLVAAGIGLLVLKNGFADGSTTGGGSTSSTHDGGGDHHDGARRPPPLQPPNPAAAKVLVANGSGVTRLGRQGHHVPEGQGSRHVAGHGRQDEGLRGDRRLPPRRLPAAGRQRGRSSSVASRWAAWCRHRRPSRAWVTPTSWWSWARSRCLASTPSDVRPAAAPADVARHGGADDGARRRRRVPAAAVDRRHDHASPSTPCCCSPC